MPGDAVAVILPSELPPDVVACVVGVEELPLLPLPLHAASVKLTMKTKKVAIKRDLECRKWDNCKPIRLLMNQRTEQGNSGKENNEHDSEIENQFLYTTPCLKHCTSTAATEDASQTCATRLKQDKNDYSYTEYNLYYPDCWKPQLRQILPRFHIAPLSGSMFIK
jgi:hypothetical protein